MTKSTSSQRGCDALLQALQSAGVQKIFTLSGNHIMPIFDAAFGAGMPLIHTRHEAAAVHMADAHARITGSVGIALVTGGPGHANAVSALYTAQMAEAPVVLLSGHAPNAQLGKGAFQEMRQAEMATPVCKAAWVCASADAVAGDLARAVSLAHSGRPGPVHLSLPTDVLDNRVQREQPLSADAFEPTAMPLPTQVADRLLHALAAARRPLVLAGPSCMTRPGRARLAALQDALGVPVVGMDSPRGIADPRLGVFAQVLAQADCIVLLGKRLDFTLKFGQTPAIAADAVLHQVDADESELSRSRGALGARLKQTALADVGSALDALKNRAGLSCSGKPNRAWLDEVESAIAWRPPAWDTATSKQPGQLHPVQMLRPLQALLSSHPDAVLICDGGEIGQWASACLDAPHR
ncbi:MAG: thiamine pyrophosphate-binding protein, partial [Burkholderiaceae bacterium]